MIKREYRCYYEGLQEEMYFNHIVKLIRTAKPNVSLKFRKQAKLTSLVKSATNVPKIAVFDYDLNRDEFEKRVKLCNGTKVLYTSLNFDLWLVLHKCQYRRNAQNNNAYVGEVRRLYGLSETANIKEENNIERILSQINLEDVKTAIANAEEIMQNKLDMDAIVVKRGFAYYPNPSMNIYEFIKELLGTAGII